MSSPVVAGSVALMLQANPNLTPNLVKAILQYTAQVYPGYNALTQGAGFLNTKGAVELARFFKTAQPGKRYPSSRQWSKKRPLGQSAHLQGRHQAERDGVEARRGVGRGQGRPRARTSCGATTAADECDNVVWGTNDSKTTRAWPVADREQHRVGHPRVDVPSDGDDNIVWGTMADEDNIVWGTDCDGADCADVVWGTRRGRRRRQHRVGHRGGGRQRRLGHQRRRSTASCGARRATTDNLTWGSSGDDAPLFDDPDVEPVTFDASVWEDLFGPDVVVPASPR